MKFLSIFFLFACAISSVYAKSSSNTGVMNAVNKLQTEVSQLKDRVSELESRQARLEKSHKATASSDDVPETKTIEHNDKKASATEKKRYDDARALFKKGSHTQAIKEFQAIIDTYPDGEYADNSQYWIGEALLKKDDKQKAMKAFDQVLRDYPQSPKVPDSLLKLGLTQTSIGNKNKAKEYYDYLIETYPSSEAANTAYAKRRQLGL